MSETTLPVLDLRRLATAEVPCITPAWAALLAEAAGTCLSEAGHSLRVRMEVRGGDPDTYEVTWDELNPDSARLWRDPDEAVEFGACGVAVVLIRELSEYSVIERSRKGTGFDYWLGHEGDELFEKRARLEVSGIRSGDEKAMQGRVRKKMKQVSVSDGALPGYVIVVEFSRPTSLFHAR